MAARQSRRQPIIHSISENFNSNRVHPPMQAGDYIRISSFAGLCPREEVLRSNLGVSRDDEVEPDLNLIFAHGSGLHYTLQNNVLPVLKVLFGRWTCLECATSYGGSAADLTPDTKLDDIIVARPYKCPKCESHEFLYRELSYVSTQYHLTGHPDGFLRLPQYEGTGILEAKSISTRGAYEVKNCPKMEHVIQAQLYLWMTGLTWAQILYWDKGTNGMSGLIEHHVERDDELLENALNTVTAIWDGIASKELPERVCQNAECPRAEKCSVKKQCFSL